jgi:hypothetical protein
MWISVLILDFGRDFQIQIGESTCVRGISYPHAARCQILLPRSQNLNIWMTTTLNHENLVGCVTIKWELQTQQISISEFCHTSAGLWESCMRYIIWRSGPGLWSMRIEKSGCFQDLSFQSPGLVCGYNTASLFILIFTPWPNLGPE